MYLSIFSFTKRICTYNDVLLFNFLYDLFIKQNIDEADIKIFKVYKCKFCYLTSTQSIMFHLPALVLILYQCTESQSGKGPLGLLRPQRRHPGPSTSRQLWKISKEKTPQPLYSAVPRPFSCIEIEKIKWDQGLPILKFVCRVSSSLAFSLFLFSVPVVWRAAFYAFFSSSQQSWNELGANWEDIWYLWFYEWPNWILIKILILTMFMVDCHNAVLEFYLKPVKVFLHLLIY